MTKEEFVKMIDTQQAFEKELERWDDFGIPMYDTPIANIERKMLNCWLSSNFTTIGQDWITWYLWERISIITHKVLPCYDGDVKFYLNNAEDLWELVKNHCKEN